MICVGVALHDAGTRDICVGVALHDAGTRDMCVGVALHDAGTHDMCGCGFAAVQRMQTSPHHFHVVLVTCILSK